MALLGVELADVTADLLVEAGRCRAQQHHRADRPVSLADRREPPLIVALFPLL